MSKILFCRNLLTNSRANYLIFSALSFIYRLRFITVLTSSRLYYIIPAYSIMDEESSSLAKNQVIVYLIVEYTPLRVISAAIFDDRKRLFQFTSFNDNEHYTNLESLLIQTNPHEREDNFFVHIAIKT